LNKEAASQKKQQSLKILLNNSSDNGFVLDIAASKSA